MAEVKKFHESFHENKDKNTQDAFLLRYIQVIPVQRRRSAAKSTLDVNDREVDPPTKKRELKKVTAKCFVPNRVQKLIPVCQAAFQGILHITKHRVQFVAQRYAASQKSPVEKRGGDHMEKKYSLRREAVKKFIKKFKCSEAHYTRGKSSIRRYLPSTLNITKMAKMYNKEKETENPDLKVKVNFFRRIFNTCFNLGFGTPRTDMCSTCLSLKERIKRESNVDQKQQLRVEYALHRKRAKAFYMLLRETDPKMITISFDCQKNQPLPKVPDQSAYYSRQLYIYNLTFVQGSSKSEQNPSNVFMYTWTEDEFRKGSKEVASMLYHRLCNTHIPREVEVMRLVCDGCGGQNKNQVVMAVTAKWLITSAPGNIKRIEFIFPTTGHSFLPSDRVFGRIETELKKYETIIRPEEYKDVFKKYGTVLELGTDPIVADWKKEVDDICKPSTSWHFKFQATKRFIITRCRKNPNNALIRGEPFYFHDSGENKSICKKGKNLGMLDPDVIERSEDVTLSSLKLRDVNRLLKKHFHSEWWKGDDLQFYVDVLKDFQVSDDHDLPEDVEDEENELEQDEDIIENDLEETLDMIV